MGLKSKIKEAKKRKKEAQAFKRIVAQRALQERRKAFAAEALRQAKLEGRRKALEQSRKRSQGSFAVRLAKGFINQRINQPVKRRAPVKRRTTKRRTTRRKAPSYW